MGYCCGKMNKNLHRLKTEDEAVPSGRSTPVFSWSPLPPRRCLGRLDPTDISYTEDENNLYPNCDASVWMRSCEEEVIEPLSGNVYGSIPQWLNGCLIRNGPGSLKVGSEFFSHLFDSSALLHRFTIENGNVTYQCRFVQSDVYKRNQAAKRIVTTEFGTAAVPDPCQTIFQKIASFFTPQDQSDNSMISVYPFGDELYAFNETPVIHRINKTTLDTEGKVNVSDYVSIVHHTSHPHVMQDGTVYNLGMSVKRARPYHNIICFPVQTNDETGSQSMFQNAHIVASIPARWPLHPSYMHTFGVTENYFIIVEQPLSLSIPSMMKSKLTNDTLAGNLRWYHDELTQINVITRKTGELEYQFFAEAFFYLHIINQYEVEDQVVLDVCSYRDPSMLDCMYIETMKNMQKMQDYAKMFRGRPIRFVLPLNVKTIHKKNKNLVKIFNTKAKARMMENGNILVIPEKLCNLGCETPRIHYEKYLGKKYRYFYAISSDVDANNPGTIIKVDAVLKNQITWCETNCYPSEPVFVPSPNPRSEDDGVILAAMVWGNDDSNRAGLLVLDAKTFKELGRAEFVTPGPTPKCLHGWFLPTNTLK